MTNLYRLLPFVLFTCVHYSLVAQTALVLNNDGYVVIDNGAFVVVNTTSTGGITQVGTGGRILSEAETDRLRWMIGTATGSYTVPFVSTGGVEIPLTLNITGAGVGAGSNVTFSTYGGSTWDNNTYRPSDVTHTLDYATGSVNNSNNTIDRFWIIDPLSYTTKPGATLSLTYIDGEHSAAGNTIVESTLGAQRFNSTSGIWGDYLPQGTINTGTNVVSAIPVTSANFFRSWTLAETTNPLAIELLSYTVSCNDHAVEITWSVASEVDLDKYQLCGSNDGVNFTVLQEVLPVGAPTTYTQTVVNGYTYYALRTIETAGTIHTEAVQTLDCNGGTNANAWINQSHVVADITLVNGDVPAFDLYDAAGKLVFTQSRQLDNGRTLLDLGSLDIARGIYFLRITSQKNNLNKTFKLLISR